MAICFNYEDISLKTGKKSDDGDTHTSKSYPRKPQKALVFGLVGQKSHDHPLTVHQGWDMEEDNRSFRKG